MNITAVSSTTPPVVHVDHPYVIFAREIYVWLVPLMVTVLLISVIGNGLIVISAPWMGRQINPYHRLCISLAASDCWAASLLITGLIVNSYMPVVLRIQKNNECVAAVLEIFRISGMLTSNLHILALATNQFVGILYPLRYKMLITTSRLRRLIFLLWIVPVVFVTSWFVLIPGDGFRDFKCRQRFYRRFPFRLSVFVSFVVPLFATFALYGFIVRYLLNAKAKSAHEMRRSVRNSYRRKVQSRLKLMWTTLLILSTFTLSWGVCVLYFLLVCVEGCPFIYMQSVSFYAGFLLSSTVNFLVALKLLFNPLIYALRMNHIRASVLACLKTVSFTVFRRSFSNHNVNFESTSFDPHSPHMVPCRSADGIAKKKNMMAVRSTSSSRLCEISKKNKTVSSESIHLLTSDDIRRRTYRYGE
ncbi:unnamed protein product [Bursaphelenchus okinawaensis]|uniref:G-protein coupled receptors family 1 profile domain-containing protein n=1 Tax=Bursaphelenchus okinawaensis TaxID=465554 RepID=A0A811KSS7_9BILA|nr:unnamed protein product [Bursaphelenchus okinawaensis]CAG9112699.1 unnamed protein product [Bursaphelenchus okinawaensis]